MKNNLEKIKKIPLVSGLLFVFLFGSVVWGATILDHSWFGIDNDLDTPASEKNDWMEGDSFIVSGKDTSGVQSITDIYSKIASGLLSESKVRVVSNSDRDIFLPNKSKEEFDSFKENSSDFGVDVYDTVDSTIESESDEESQILESNYYDNRGNMCDVTFVGVRYYKSCTIPTYGGEYCSEGNNFTWTDGSVKDELEKFVVPVSTTETSYPGVKVSDTEYQRYLADEFTFDSSTKEDGFYEITAEKHAPNTSRVCTVDSGSAELMPGSSRVYDYVCDGNQDDRLRNYNKSKCGGSDDVETSEPNKYTYDGQSCAGAKNSSISKRDTRECRMVDGDPPQEVCDWVRPSCPEGYRVGIDNDNTTGVNKAYNDCTSGSLYCDTIPYRRAATKVCIPNNCRITGSRSSGSRDSCTFYLGGCWF
ncbi:hypothetical protein ACFLY7_00690 [Patescibacteria group bacterium]